MTKKPTIAAILAHARHAQRAMDPSLEPDPNDDPVTALDRQWHKERIRSMGMAAGDDTAVIMHPLVLIGCFALFFTLGVVFWRQGYALFGRPLLFLGLSLFILLLLPNNLRYALGKRRYLKRRATLITQYGDPHSVAQSLGAAHRLSYSWPHQSGSAAETRFHAVQAAYYDAATRDQGYHDQIQQCIAHAPAADQPYLRALAQLERDWVNERSRYALYTNASGAYQKPTLALAWIALVIGLGLIAGGIMAAADGKSLLWTVFLWFFGAIMGSGFLGVRKYVTAFDAAEQRYFGQRQTLGDVHKRAA